MRSTDDLRQWWLDDLSRMLTRPEMWATDGRAMDTLCWMRLRDLCFLDDRDTERDQTVELLRRYGKLGVSGPFTTIFGKERTCTAEVASVHAEHFHRLGYLTVDRHLSPNESAALDGSQLREWVGKRDLRRSEVEATFGPPSLVIAHRILCYTPADASGWVFFDCWDEQPRRYVPGEGTYTADRETDPLVRSVRVPAADFEDGLILTLYGRVLRWGPEWWIHHPGDDATDEAQAIAAQLRHIEQVDPSQRSDR
ncbi:hypothetical protein AB0M43_21265 [Longispora sp. NPDC051575]|uniref:hypothetical protein n=1 Tax=Longispora sp. NPDC051575 TaxID=3154943 RepID=UPI003428D839